LAQATIWRSSCDQPHCSAIMDRGVQECAHFVLEVKDAARMMNNMPAKDVLSDLEEHWNNKLSSETGRPSSRTSLAVPQTRASSRPSSRSLSRASSRSSSKSNLARAGSLATSGRNSLHQPSEADRFVDPKVVNSTFNLYCGSNTWEMDCAQFVKLLNARGLLECNFTTENASSIFRMHEREGFLNHQRFIFALSSVAKQKGMLAGTVYRTIAGGSL